MSCDIRVKNLYTSSGGLQLSIFLNFTNEDPYLPIPHPQVTLPIWVPEVHLTSLLIYLSQQQQLNTCI